MPKFNKKALDYFTEHEQRFEFSKLTFEFYKRFGYFPFVGDNHLGEFLQFGEEFTQTKDMIDWIDLNDKAGQSVYKKFLNNHKRLKKGKYPKKGILFNRRSGERAIPIIEEIITDKNYYEFAVNIANDDIINNLPEDLILECSAIVNRQGVKGVKIGALPKNIAAVLRIEATIQDLCVDAVLNRSKNTAISCLAIDPNVGNFEMAEDIFNEMVKTQKDFLPQFK